MSNKWNYKLLAIIVELNVYVSNLDIPEDATDVVVSYAVTKERNGFQVWIGILGEPFNDGVTHYVPATDGWYPSGTRARSGAVEFAVDHVIRPRAAAAKKDPQS